MFRALLYAGDEAAALTALQGSLDEAGRKEIAGLAAPEAIRRMVTQWAGSMRSPYQRALMWAWLRRKEEALAQIEEAKRTRNSMMPMVAVDPGFAELRGDARFRRIVGEMGL
jgi:hypothetical protein